MVHAKLCGTQWLMSEWKQIKLVVDICFLAPAVAIKYKLGILYVLNIIQSFRKTFVDSGWSQSNLWICMFMRNFLDFAVSRVGYTSSPCIMWDRTHLNGRMPRMCGTQPAFPVFSMSIWMGQVQLVRYRWRYRNTWKFLGNKSKSWRSCSCFGQSCSYWYQVIAQHSSTWLQNALCPGFVGR